MSSQTAAEEERIYTDAFVGDNSWNGRERNVILLNRGAGEFLSAAPALELDSLYDARGLALADFDQDGDVDLAINNYLAPAQLFRNERGQERGWASFRLVGRAPNTQAVGAILRARVGGQILVRLVGVGHGYASQYSLEQQFGLGAASAIEELSVTWPDGQVERFGPFASRGRYTLTQGSAPARGPAAAAAPAGSPAPVGWGARGLAWLGLILGLGAIWFLGSSSSARLP